MVIVFYTLLFNFRLPWILVVLHIFGRVGRKITQKAETIHMCTVKHIQILF